MKKRMSTLLHTHVALIILTACATLDAACVIGQIISDILIMKDELHEKEILEATSKEIVFKTFPHILNQTIHGNWSLPSMLTEVQNQIGHTHSDGFEHNPLEQMAKLGKIPWHDINNDTGATLDLGTLLGRDHFHDHTHEHSDFHTHTRRKRGAGGDHKHDIFQTDAAKVRHYMLHELTHAFHLGSMVILTFLVLITYFKIFIMGKKFLHHKIEVFDAFIITVSWALDLVFWEGLWAHPEDEAANIMIFILPWRVVRIVNSFVLVIQGRDLLQLKIVKQQYRGSVKRANDLKMKVEIYRVEVKNLQSLAKRKGANEKEIQSCAANGGGRRRRSSLLPVLNRLASLGLSVNSQTDLTKSSYEPEPPTPADSDDDLDSTYVPSFSRMSSVSLDDFNLGRTVSNSTTSTLPLGPRMSVNSTYSTGEDNPVFEDNICQNPKGDDGVDTKL
ncbi:Voltage-gated hydrogen channel 1 [Mactra antiquata]